MNFVLKFFLLAIALGCVPKYAECNEKPGSALYNNCMYEATGDPKYCDRIEQKDFRLTCKARAHRQESICFQIENRDTREFCLYMLR